MIIFVEGKVKKYKTDVDNFIIKYKVKNHKVIDIVEE